VGLGFQRDRSTGVYSGGPRRIIIIVLGGALERSIKEKP